MRPGPPGPPMRPAPAAPPMRPPGPPHSGPPSAGPPPRAAQQPGAPPGARPAAVGPSYGAPPISGAPPPPRPINTGTAPSAPPVFGASRQQQQQPAAASPRASPSRTRSGRSPRSPRSPRRAGSASPRVDARKLPRYPLTYVTEAFQFTTRTEPSTEHPEQLHQIPRRADSEVITRDLGSCAAHFMRATVNNFPASKDDAVRPPFRARMLPLARRSLPSEVRRGSSAHEA